MGAMVDVKVTVQVGSKKVSVEDLTDKRIASQLRATGREVGQKIGAITCPTHQQAAKNVRIHFDKSGAADLQYDSCCDALGQKISQALG
jgi:hypothetical protein